MKRLRPPARVRIKRGRAYDVYRFQNLNLDGLCDRDKMAIFLNENLNAKGIETTLLHEALHAMDFEWHIGLTEKQVLRLERALVTFLRLNKEWLNV